MQPTFRGVCKGRHGVLAPNGCMIVQSTINNIIVSGEAILGVENSGKPLGGRDSAPNPAGGAHSAPPDPLAGEEGLLPPPQEPRPAGGLRPFGLVPPMKYLAHALANLVQRNQTSNHSCSCRAPQHIVDDCLLTEFEGAIHSADDTAVVWFGTQCKR